MSTDETPRAVSRATGGSSPWRIRAAGVGDVEAVARAVRELLVELGGTPPGSLEMQDAARALIKESEAGAVFVAQAGERLVGVIAASWQTAIHVPGPLAVIQDLWVDSEWRGQAIGAGLLDTLVALGRSRRIRRVEVGLPLDTFAGFAMTEAFYLGHGFRPNGPRMRRTLS
jgi:GNAT superfamily N-acetyltransferase